MISVQGKYYDWEMEIVRLRRKGDEEFMREGMGCEVEEVLKGGEKRFWR